MRSPGKVICNESVQTGHNVALGPKWGMSVLQEETYRTNKPE